MARSRVSWPFACVCFVGLVSGIHLDAQEDAIRLKRGGLYEAGQGVTLAAPATNATGSESESGKAWEEWLDMASFRPPWPKRADRVQLSHLDGRRVAVLTSGTLKKYFLTEAAEGLVQPMVSAGFAVDYYLALSAAGFESWNKHANRYKPDVAPLDKLPAVEQMINQTISSVGGRVRSLQLLHDVELEDNEKSFIQTGAWNGLHGGVHARTNVLKMLKPLQRLGEAMQRVEADDGAYDYVIILKDDSIWLKPFDLKMLLRNTLYPVSSKQDGFILKCDSGKSTYSPSPNELTEYIFVLRREVAAPFYMMHSLLINGSMSGQEDLLRRQIYRSATNFEEFAKKVATGFSLALQPTPPIFLPMQRGGRLEVEGEVKTCLHKFCDSEVPGMPTLRPKSVYPACSDLTQRAARPLSRQSHLREAAHPPEAARPHLRREAQWGDPREELEYEMF